MFTFQFKHNYCGCSRKLMIRQTCTCEKGISGLHLFVSARNIRLIIEAKEPDNKQMQKEVNKNSSDLVLGTHTVETSFIQI